ncbi:hypothetical protein BJV82DRAFT_142316 [Fennellomyces sp. T-0311]|nr:hypothetical protein BJV82DRAFT_142316 [Fennellomyces sp. T-0311]
MECDRNLSTFLAKKHRSVALLSQLPYIKRQIKQQLLEPLGSNMNDILFATIQQFSTTLTELSITNHRFDISEMHLLNLLPNLTHLTLLYDGMSHLQQPNIGVRSNGIEYSSTKLVYLHVDCYLKDRINPLLRRCPRLKSLLLTTTHGTLLHSAPPGPDFETLFDHCPRLRYLMWMPRGYFPSDNEDEKTKEWKELSRRVGYDDKKSLCEFILHSFHMDLEIVVPLLTRSRHTLEYLKFRNLRRPREWDGLNNIQFPRLKTLHINGILTTYAGWGNFIAGCDDIECLDLLTVSQDDVQVDPLFTALSTRKHLKHIDMQVFIPEDDPYEQAVSHIDRFPHLGMLSMNGQLQSVRLTNVCIPGQALLDLCNIRSLQVLHLAVDPCHAQCLSFDEMKAFADRLISVDSKLYVLSFDWIYNITDAVLDRLGRLKWLSLLSVTCSPHITNDGVDSFFKNDANLNKKFQQLGCREVSGYDYRFRLLADSISVLLKNVL